MTLPGSAARGTSLVGMGNHMESLSFAASAFLVAGFTSSASSASFVFSVKLRDSEFMQ